MVELKIIILILFIKNVDVDFRQNNLKFYN